MLPPANVPRLRQRAHKKIWVPKERCEASTIVLKIHQLFSRLALFRSLPRCLVSPLVYVTGRQRLQLENPASNVYFAAPSNVFVFVLPSCLSLVNSGTPEVRVRGTTKT